MALTTSFRQVNEKHLQTQIIRIVWSPRMDLLALATCHAQVLLYRLSWQRVWIHQPSKDSLQVVGLVWRPDGLVLAIGYSNGTVQLLDVETANIVHEILLPQPLLCCKWMAAKDNQLYSFDSQNINSFMSFKSKSEMYLPKLSGFNKRKDEFTEDVKKIDRQTVLDLLLLVSQNFRIFIFAFGVVPVAMCDILTNSVHDFSLDSFDVLLSDDLKLLSVVVKLISATRRQSVVQFALDTSLLAVHVTELHLLGKTFGRILSLGSHLETCMEQLKEAWEDILLEMDSKLMKLADDKYKLGTGAISTDLLRLFMLGTASDELKLFLLHDLTDKGLKKLVISVQSSYGNMQKLLVKHVFEVCQTLMFYLEDVRGMSLCSEWFGRLGLSSQCVEEAIRVVGSFALKVQELQQALDDSLKNLRAFFRWLYVAIERLSGDKVTQDYSKMSQHELANVTSFLKNSFKHSDSAGRTVIRLENIAQYLKPTPLVDSMRLDNHWSQFLDQQMRAQQMDQQSAGGALFYDAMPDKSLAQVHDIMKLAIDNVLNNCATVTGQSVQCVQRTLLWLSSNESGNDSNNKLIVSQMCKYLNDACYVYFVILDKASNQIAYIVRQATRKPRLLEGVAIETTFPMEPALQTKCPFADVSMYNSEIVSLLFSHPQSEQTTVLAQLPLVVAEQNMQPLVDVGSGVSLHQLPAIDVSDSLRYRCMDKFVAAYFAVSGTRNVACVVAAGNNRLRLFLMDADEDDEEREHNNSKSNVSIACDDDNAQQNSTCTSP